MYVCHCRAVNDRTVRAAADAGALTVDDLMRSCGAGTDCGGCHSVLQELLATSTATTTAGSTDHRVPELVG